MAPNKHCFLSFHEKLCSFKVDHFFCILLCANLKGNDAYEGSSIEDSYIQEVMQLHLQHLLNKHAACCIKSTRLVSLCSFASCKVPEDHDFILHRRMVSLLYVRYVL